MHKSASYPAVLKKIKDQLYGNAEDPTSVYYLADSTGLPVCVDGTIIIQDENGSDRAVEWTIETYMTISNIKYQSKLRLYCVLKKASESGLL